MNVAELIEALRKMDGDLNVVLTNSSGTGWKNISSVEECGGEVEIREDNGDFFL